MSEINSTAVRRMTPPERLRRMRDFGEFFFGPEWKAPTYRLLAGKAPQGPTWLTRQRWDRIVSRDQDVVPDWMVESMADYIDEKCAELHRLSVRFRGK